jgi:hypothetical protein
VIEEEADRKEEPYFFLSAGLKIPGVSRNT